ncbi:MAG: YesL family protein, partial [Eubacteriales bacterium]|nr:YesL family protein [Eubacteriales bacterium]
MGRLFSTETPIYQWLMKVSTILLTGIVWLLLCLPIITAGASTTAMYRIMFNIRDEKPSGIGHFFKYFAEEFKKGTLLFLIDILCVILLAVIYLVLYSFVKVGNEVSVLAAIFLVPLFIWMITFLYVFPLNAFFDNTVGRTILNAFMLSVRYFKYTVPSLFITMLPLFGFMLLGFYYFMYSVPFWFFIIIPVGEYIKSGLFKKAFIQIMPKQETTEEA